MSGPQQGRPAPPQGAAAARIAAEKQQAIVATRNIAQIIQANANAFRQVIPKHLDPDRMMRVALSAINRDSKLLACTAPSLMRSVMQSSILGLEIGVMGEAYLVPFKNGGVLEATFIPGYQGLIKLAIQSGSVAAVQVGAVYPEDEFDYGLGSAPFVKHKPTLKVKVPERLLAAYAVCKLTSGEFQATIMGKEEIDAIRSRSRAKDSGPWVTDYEQMAIKTVVRRALKYVPKTPNLMRAMEAEDRAESGMAGRAMMADLLPETDVPLPGEDAVDVTPGRPADSVTQAADALGAGPPVSASQRQPDDDPPPEPGSDG